MKKIQTIRSIEPFLSGRIAVDDELPYLTTLYDGNVLSVSESGEILSTLETKNANCVAIKRNRVAAGCHNHIQIYEDGELKATMKHSATVLCMDFHPSGLLLVAGYSDTTVRVWDLRHYRCTHAFKGHSSIVSTVIFHPTDLKAISGCEDGKIKIWSLETRACLATLDSHVSLITDLSCHNGILLSVGRDKILSIWDLSTNTLKHTILAFEMLESVGLVKDSVIFAAGERGIIRLWDLNSVKEIAESESLSSLGIVQAVQKDNTIYCVTQDRNILIYNVDDDQNLARTKCLIGFNDEILDSVFLGSDENHLCIASNSEILKVYDMNTFDCDLVHGHSEIILCLANSPVKELLATGSKDQTTRVWSMVDGHLQTVATCKGHTGAVTAIAFSGKTGQSLFTCSQDHTVKHWKVPAKFTNDQQLEAEYTVAAHDGDINSIDVSPNEKFFCTGSQDKMAKIWKSEDGSLVGVLKGHRRGVWNTRFSPVEQVVVTSSGDKTIKIWSLSDLSCLKTFEGHQNSVLKTLFLNSGTQLISAGADGLIKLWDIKTNECIETYDHHEDKVWALTVSKKENQIITGSADSKLCVWKDVTEEFEEEERIKKEKKILKEQELDNLVYKRDYSRACHLALELEQPLKLWKLFKDMMAENGFEKKHFTDFIQELTPEKASHLMKYVRDWNTSARFCLVSQMIIHAMLEKINNETFKKLLQQPEMYESLIAYTTRHYSRIEDMKTNIRIVEFAADVARNRV